MSSANPATVNYSVVVPAAGSGTRMKAGLRKPFLELNGRPLVLHTLQRLSQAAGCRSIVLAVHPDDLQVYQAWEELLSIAPRRITIMSGGGTRQESVFRALSETPSDPGYVLIHDAARPLIRVSTVEKVAAAAYAHNAAIAAIPARETVKYVDENRWIKETPDRSKLWMTHTPQGFKRGLILAAHRTALANNFRATDDASLVENIHKRVKIVRSCPDNIKITTPEDLAIAEALLRWQQKQRLPESDPTRFT